MKLLITGTRGIPNIPGGVETHCEQLFPLIQGKIFDITVARRSAYVTPENKISEYKGVKLVDIFSPKKKSIEAIMHTFLAVCHAKRKGFKYIHIHAIGPALMIPFARLLGLKVVMTHHGPDYDRQKWGRTAKVMLKAGEYCAAKFANEIIVISENINNILKIKYSRHNAHLIYNGVNLPTPTISDNYIKKLKLQRGNYIIAVGRFVPEKGFHDLIEAYLQSGIKQKLVLAGDADHETDYSRNLKQQAKTNGIVLTGFIKGEKLNEIFTHTALFVMPSYHEGLPFALLEAMSYNLNVLVSDIPANKEVGLAADSYFQCGNVVQLAEKLQKNVNSKKNSNFTEILKEKYNWKTIAEQTKEVYNLLEK
jgi:glycosyltransferase involved in cell wall biosynthesis